MAAVRAVTPHIALVPLAVLAAVLVMEELPWVALRRTHRKEITAALVLTEDDRIPLVAVAAGLAL